MIDENIHRASGLPTCDEISCLLISWTHLLGGEPPLVPDESPPEIFFMKFSFFVKISLYLLRKAELPREKGLLVGQGCYRQFLVVDKRCGQF